MLLHIYENELLISFIQRYYKINGRTAIKYIFNELFDIDKVTIDSFIPTNISRLCEHTANKYGWDEEMIISKHTLFNYVTGKYFWRNFGK